MQDLDNAHSDADSATPWLLDHKVEPPDLVTGYVERRDLETRCAPMNRHLTVLQAPGGFGKTALLARCCRQLREEGNAVAWLALDEEDSAVRMATYLTLAFERAGVKSIDATGQPGSSDTPTLESDSQARYRINLLIRAIARHEAPCLLVLDELDRLRNAEAIGVLNALLANSPRNLRIAMAFRERPPGLDIAMFMLEGRGETVTAEELRFSTRDIASFFDTKLSRRELASVADKSAGWPIALRIFRNAMQTGAAVTEIGGEDDTIAAWIESRLWRGVPDEDRDFVLDVALFDWIDTELIDETTGASHSRRRFESMTSLTGLSQTTGGEKSTMQLHPLIREHCANRRFRENPSRFRSIHAGIARGLARRGQVVDALRHAAEAGDPQLIGQIATTDGGIHLWIRGGFDALQAMDGWLTPEVMDAYPRLALVRCVVLAMSGDMQGARRVYQTAAIASAGFTRDPAGTEDPQMKLDHLVVLGLLLVFGCVDISGYEPLVATASAVARDPEVNPLLRGLVRYGLCLCFNEMTEFDQAAAWSEAARADLGHNTPYVSPHLDYQRGLAAMAQGRTSDAAAAYERALRLGRVTHLGNATSVIVGEILMAELELERSARTSSPHAPRFAPRLLGECGAWLDVYAANTGVAAELALEHGGVDSALAAVESATSFARATERSALVTLLSALRVSLLVTGQRVDEAARAWQSAALPDTDEQCLDFKRRRWREVEALASARLRLLIAQGEFDRARELATRVCTVAAERQLLRTLMRTLVLSMRLEHCAGNPERATQHLVEFLQRYEQADYARPLAREREIAMPLLHAVVRSRPSASLAATATALLDALTPWDEAAESDEAGQDRYQPLLSADELTVLQRLDSQTDKAIARDLNLTYDGVRYRIRKIFSKLGACSRYDAIHRARAAGILPDDGGTTPFDL